MVGVYGVISYSVSERTREIGVRVALGASWGQISKMILSQGMSVTFIGIAIGLAGAYVISKVTESLLFEVSATDISIFMVVPVLLAAVSAIACLVPARRAAKVDPMVALREE
jgi:ABC-type antimicrobial peptide transport system permease subunit